MGLDREHARAKAALNQAGPATNAVVLLGIDSPEDIFGLCNFKFDEGDDYDLKFSEKWEKLEMDNIELLVRSFRVTQFIVPEPSLRQKVEQVLRRWDLNAYCE